MAPPSHHPTGRPGELALIDITSLGDGGRGAERVAALIDEACRRLGFFRITGHGIDPDLFDRMAELAGNFFRRGMRSSLRCRSMIHHPPMTPIVVGTAPACGPGRAPTAAT